MKAKRIMRKFKMQILDSFFLCTSPELIPCKNGITSKKYGAKFILDVRDIWPEVLFEMGAIKEISLIYKFFKINANILYKKSDLLISVSEKKCEYLSKVTDKKVYWVGNGFDPDDLLMKSDVSVLQHIPLENKKVISYVGNVGKAQGILFLVKAFELISSSDIVLLIGGKGSDLPFIKKYVFMNKVNNVYFLGPIPKAQAKAVLQASDLCYIPLLNDDMQNSVPTKLFDSLAFGTPVLLASSGESADILNESGFGLNISVIDSKKPEILSKHLLNFILNINDYSKNKQKAYDLILTKYNRKKYNEFLVDILNTLS
jgi:glycosyltransferase involved in cell wall biosynthesis